MYAFACVYMCMYGYEEAPGEAQRWNNGEDSIFSSAYISF